MSRKSHKIPRSGLREIALLLLNQKENKQNVDNSFMNDELIFKYFRLYPVLRLKINNLECFCNRFTMFCLPFSYDWVDTKNEQFYIKIQKPFHKEHVDATNFHLKMSYLTLAEWKEFPKNQPIIWHILINFSIPLLRNSTL